MKLSVSIMHAPWDDARVASVREILSQIPGAVVVADSKRDGVKAVGRRIGPWPIASRAWKARDPHATHHVVLEDDAMLCDDFMARVAEVVLEQPASVISLFEGPRAYSAVATVMPVPILLRWLPWADYESRLVPNHDLLINKGMMFLKVPRFVTKPSLVEHRDVPSLLSHSHVRANVFVQAPSDVTLELR